MLKHKRKANKAALIANSRIYGMRKLFSDVSKYHVWHLLSTVHGPDKARLMVLDAISVDNGEHGTCRRYHAGVWGFVVWSTTDYYGEWVSASDVYNR